MNPLLCLPSSADYLASLPRKPMRILVACEFSGRCRDRLIARGHDAISCDLLDTDAPGPHVQGDVMELLAQPWDMVLAFPPCTYITSSQLWRCLPKHDPEGERWHKREEALEFIAAVLNANSPRILLENPKGCIGTRLYWDDVLEEFAVRSYWDAEDAKASGRDGNGLPKRTLPPSQMVQPWQFGNPEAKGTCFWLQGLPRLKATNVLDIEEHGYWHEGEQKWRWLNQTGKGGNKLGETYDENGDPMRWKYRSLTYEGIADAMASQYTLDLMNG